MSLRTPAIGQVGPVSLHHLLVPKKKREYAKLCEQMHDFKSIETCKEMGALAAHIGACVTKYFVNLFYFFVNKENETKSA